MPTITIEVTEQEHATLAIAARMRGTMKDGVPDWKEFHRPWHVDAYQSVQQAAATRIADDPTASAQILAQLNAQLDAEDAAAAPAPVEESHAPTTNENAPL